MLGQLPGVGNRDLRSLLYLHGLHAVDPGPWTPIRSELGSENQPIPDLGRASTRSGVLRPAGSPLFSRPPGARLPVAIGSTSSSANLRIA